MMKLWSEAMPSLSHKASVRELLVSAGALPIHLPARQPRPPLQKVPVILPRSSGSLQVNYCPSHQSLLSQLMPLA